MHPNFSLGLRKFSKACFVLEYIIVFLGFSLNLSKLKFVKEFCRCLLSNVEDNLLHVQ